jgi:hypothetical protein
MPIDPLHAAIQDLLVRAPRTWAAIDRDGLSAPEERAVGLLAAAGLIEVRVGLEFSMAGQAQGLRLTLETSGETGLAQALAPVLSDLLLRWESALGQARQRGITDPVALQPIGGTAWRISEQGLRARADLTSADPEVRAAVFSFVLTRPVQGANGRQFLVAVDPAARVSDLRDVPLLAIDGRTTVRERTWTTMGSSAAVASGPVAVAVQNWHDGADAIATAVAQILPGIHPAPTAASAASSTRPGTDPSGWTGAAKLALLRYLQQHPSVRSRKQIMREAAQAGAGEPVTVKRNLADLKAAGWLSQNADGGTCLSEKGIRECAKKLGEHR